MQGRGSGISSGVHRCARGDLLPRNRGLTRWHSIGIILPRAQSQVLSGAPHHPHGPEIAGDRGIGGTFFCVVVVVGGGGVIFSDLVA